MAGLTTKYRILEIGFNDWLASTFPSNVDYIDVKFSWSDVKQYQKANQSLSFRVIHLFQAFANIVSRGLLQDFDIVVVRALGKNTGNSGFTSKLKSIMGYLFRWIILFSVRGNRVKLVVIDLDDYASIDLRDRAFLKRADLFFKRELQVNPWMSIASCLPSGADLGAVMENQEMRKWVDKLRPISLGVSKVLQKSVSDKKYDLFYSGDSHYLPIRFQIKKELEVLKALGLRVYYPNEKLNLQDFLQAIQDSWIVLSPAGSGWDCYRHYEVLASGGVLLANYPTIQRHSPLKHGQDCLYYDPAFGFASVVKQYIQDKKLLIEIGASGRTIAQKHHTHQALAQYIIAELEKT